MGGESSFISCCYVIQYYPNKKDQISQARGVVQTNLDVDLIDRGGYSEMLTDYLDPAQNLSSRVEQRNNIMSSIQNLSIK